MNADIYITVSSAFPQVSEKMYGYVLATEIRGEVKTREGFGECEATYHGAVLEAMAAALGRFNKRCDICIHSEDAYVMNTLEKIEYWKERGYLNASGQPMGHQQNWMKIGAESVKHCISGVIEKHEFTSWLQQEMERKKEESRKEGEEQE